MQDVLIVGAGPAGSTAALCLARAGVSVRLLDKSRFPRPKLCGGYLSSRSLGLLDELHGPHMDQSLYHHTDDHFELYHDYSLVTQRSLGMPMAYVMREDFDDFLLGQAMEAGAQFDPDAEVLEAEAGSGHLRLHLKSGESRQGSFLVAADGANSRLRRQQDPRARCGNVALEFEATTNEAVLPRLDFGVIPQGYGWVFPKRGCHTVGVISRRTNSSELREMLDNYASSLGYKPESVKGWPLPDTLHRPVCEGRILFVGDAAGLCDPLSGEGIYQAMRSGQKAAHAILVGLEEEETFAAQSCARSYTDAIGFLQRQHTGIRIARNLFHRPGLQKSILSRFADLPDLGQIEVKDILQQIAGLMAERLLRS